MTALPSTEDLARLAKAITPGPWKAGRHPWPTQVGCCPLPGRPYEISHEMRNLAAANTIADAEAIALLPALIREVLDRREAEAGMRALLLAGCELMEIEAEGLRDGISIKGVMSPGPEDRATVEAIDAMEDWIASVKATLYPTTEAVPGNLRQRIYALLRDYRQDEVRDEDGYGYPLVDALTITGHGIDMGEREIMNIADMLAYELAHPPQPSETVAEAAAVLLGNPAAVKTLVDFQLRHSASASDKARSSRHVQMVAALRTLKGEP